MLFNEMFLLSVISAALFGLAYFPALSRLSRNLVSPYPKANIKKRLLAATIDVFLVAASFLLYWYWNSVLFVVSGAMYLLVRDAMQGRSFGKFSAGLVVISLHTGRPVTLTKSVARNLLFVLPGANLVAIFLEVFAIVGDPQGQRLGDKLAQTQVVEGLGAKELVKFAEQWWRSFLAELRPFPERPDRQPVDVDRAK
jgi:uncharacterized RDD family membrane protein YckC